MWTKKDISVQLKILAVIECKQLFVSRQLKVSKYSKLCSHMLLLLKIFLLSLKPVKQFIMKVIPMRYLPEVWWQKENKNKEISKAYIFYCERVLTVEDLTVHNSMLWYSPEEFETFQSIFTLIKWDTFATKMDHSESLATIVKSES